MLCDRTWRSTRHSPLERSLCGERSAPRGGLVVVAAVVAAAAVEVAAVAELLEEEVQELARLDGCPPRKGGPREGTKIRARAARCMTAEPAERASEPPLGASAVPLCVHARKLRAWVVIATLWDASSRHAGIRQCTQRGRPRHERRAERERARSAGRARARARRGHGPEPNLKRMLAHGARRVDLCEIQEARVDNREEACLPGLITAEKKKAHEQGTLLEV